MEAKVLLRIIRRWAWLGALPVVVVIGMLSLSYRPPEASYQVVMRFTAGGEPAPVLSPDYDRYYAWLTSEYIANGLADLANTGRFAADVAARLAEGQLAVAPEAIQSAIVTDNAQSVLVVYLTWPDPDQAELVADAVSATLLDVGPHYFPQMGTIGGVIRQADPAFATRLAPALRVQLLGPLVRLAIAAAVGVGLIALAHALDPWVRDTADLKDLGLSVSGTIPRARRRQQ